MEDSVALRQEKERAKALEKYGEIALAPSGHPDYDVFDYAINEVVGMIRYGEMLQERIRELANEEPVAVYLSPGIAKITQEMRDFGQRIGSQLVYARKELLQAKVNLGKTEAR